MISLIPPDKIFKKRSRVAKMRSPAPTPHIRHIYVGDLFFKAFLTTNDTRMQDRNPVHAKTEAQCTGGRGIQDETGLSLGREAHPRRVIACKYLTEMRCQVLSEQQISDIVPQAASNGLSVL